MLSASENVNLCWFSGVSVWYVLFASSPEHKLDPNPPESSNHMCRSRVVHHWSVTYNNNKGEKVCLFIFVGLV